MNNETKQTPIETFIEKLEEIGDIRDCTSIGLIQLNIDKNEYIELKKQAKEMEKEKLKDAWKDGRPYQGNVEDRDAEQWYNETYGGNK